MILALLNGRGKSMTLRFAISVGSAFGLLAGLGCAVAVLAPLRLTFDIDDDCASLASLCELCWAGLTCIACLTLGGALGATGGVVGMALTRGPCPRNETAQSVSGEFGEKPPAAAP